MCQRYESSRTKECRMMARGGRQGLGVVRCCKSGELPCESGRVRRILSAIMAPGPAPVPAAESGYNNYSYSCCKRCHCCCFCCCSFCCCCRWRRQRSVVSHFNCLSLFNFQLFCYCHHGRAAAHRARQGERGREPVRLPLLFMHTDTALTLPASLCSCIYAEISASTFLTCPFALPSNWPRNASRSPLFRPLQTSVSAPFLPSSAFLRCCN